MISLLFAMNYTTCCTLVLIHRLKYELQTFSFFVRWKNYFVKIEK